MSPSMTTVSIYTDGACSGNPGPGGWAAIVIPEETPEATEQLTGGEAYTTNNKMELRAALEALRALDASANVTLHTDSEYLSKAFNEGWLDSWQKNDWQTSSNNAVKNQGLWKALLEEADRHDVEWVWVKGHADNELNNMADELAVAAMERFK
ncbi:MAG: ribonuclease HI [Bacteroidetes bacterium QS_1_63_11]|nr:MAG: ribonuclease HI [Bacteroidetes bacterium QS_1_63_11]